jgi:hypothetical protein
MAAAITTASTTLEGQALEIMVALQGAELAAPEATRPDNIQVDFSTEDKRASISVSLPVELVVVAGAPKFNATVYLA